MGGGVASERSERIEGDVVSDAGRSGDVTLADVADGSRIGFVHSAETTSGVNGPGLRYTVFLSGCPLRCLYCHNPDTQTMRLGERTTARRVIEEAGRYRAFIAHGGGLTVTGGEPLLQPAFVEDLFVGVKEAYGLHTALDTSANGGHRASERLLANTDLVLLDIKAGNAALYEKVSGGGQLSDVLAFGARLVDHQVQVWIRFVLVPGLTDGPEQIAEVADLAAELGEHRRSGRGAALPPARRRQVRRARARVPAARHARADPGVGGRRRWRSSASAACTPWPDQVEHPRARVRGRHSVSMQLPDPLASPTCMDHRAEGSTSALGVRCGRGVGGSRAGRQAGEDVLGGQRAGRPPVARERAPLRHMSRVAQLTSPRRRTTRATAAARCRWRPRYGWIGA